MTLFPIDPLLVVFGRGRIQLRPLAVSFLLRFTQTQRLVPAIRYADGLTYVFNDILVRRRLRAANRFLSFICTIPSGIHIASGQIGNAALRGSKFRIQISA